MASEQGGRGVQSTACACLGCVEGWGLDARGRGLGMGWGIQGQSEGSYPCKGEAPRPAGTRLAYTAGWLPGRDKLPLLSRAPPLMACCILHPRCPLRHHDPSSVPADQQAVQFVLPCLRTMALPKAVDDLHRSPPLTPRKSFTPAPPPIHTNPTCTAPVQSEPRNP